MTLFDALAQGVVMYAVATVLIAPVITGILVYNRLVERWNARRTAHRQRVLNTRLVLAETERIINHAGESIP